MGTTQSKNFIGSITTKDGAENHTFLNENVSIPSDAPDSHHMSPKELHLEFIKLYAHSRNTLYIAPNGKLHHHIAPGLQWNFKSLNGCCNRIETYSKGIEDMVTERLETTGKHEYTIPSTDSESIGSYINSSNRAHCDTVKPPPPSGHGQGNGPQPNESLETGADVM